MKTGIYQLKSKIKNKIYIGSAVNIDKRWKEHVRTLLLSTHHNIYLQRHVDKYGLEDIEFIILENCDKEKLIDLEQNYIDVLQPHFNIAKIANSSLGIKRRLETIEKLRKVHTGVKHPEWRNKLKSESQGGEKHWTKKKEKPFSEDSKRKMSESHKKLYEDGYENPRKKPILQYDLEGNFIKEWSSVTEAMREYGASIRDNLNKKYKQAYGFKWNYKNT